MGRLGFGPLLVLLALAGCSGAGPGQADYPDDFVLAADEVPTGLAVVEPAPESEHRGNAAKIPKEAFTSEALAPIGSYGPSELWGELFNIESTSSPDFMILAGKWDSSDEASQASNRIKSDFASKDCPDSGYSNPPQFVYLRLESVLVMVQADDFEDYTEEEGRHLMFIVRALTAKTPALEEFLKVCW